MVWLASQETTDDVKRLAIIVIEKLPDLIDLGAAGRR